MATSETPSPSASGCFQCRQKITLKLWHFAKFFESFHSKFFKIGFDLGVNFQVLPNAAQDFVRLVIVDKL